LRDGSAGALPPRAPVPCQVPVTAVALVVRFFRGDRPDRMADLGICVGSRGGGAPERVPTAVPAMQMAQAQEAVAPHQHPPPLFLDFSHGGNRIKPSTLFPAMKGFRSVLLWDGEVGWVDADPIGWLMWARRLRHREEAAARGGGDGGCRVAAGAGPQV
jgi:hypothetical protein